MKALQQNTSIQQLLLFNTQLTADAQKTISDTLKSDSRGKSVTGNPEDKKVIETLQKVRICLPARAPSTPRWFR